MKIAVNFPWRAWFAVFIKKHQFFRQIGLPALVFFQQRHRFINHLFAVHIKWNGVLPDHVAGSSIWYVDVKTCKLVSLRCFHFIRFYGRGSILLPEMPGCVWQASKKCKRNLAKETFSPRKTSCLRKADTEKQQRNRERERKIRKKRQRKRSGKKKKLIDIRFYGLVFPGFWTWYKNLLDGFFQLDRWLFCWYWIFDNLYQSTSGQK